MKRAVPKLPHLNSLKYLVLSAPLVLAGCDNASPPSKTYEYTLAGAYAAAISDDGHYSLVGAFNHGGSGWDNNRNVRLYNWNHAEGEFSVISAGAFSPEGKYAVTATPQSIALWDVNNGQSAGFWSAPAEILDIDLSFNGDMALLGLANHTATYFDVKNGGERQVMRHPARVGSVDLSHDGKWALTGSDDYVSRLWNIETGELVKEVTLGNTVDTVALSNDGRLAFSAASLDQAVIWDTQTGKVLHDLTAVAGFFEKRISYLSARFSENNQRLLVGSSSGLVQLWDVNSGKRIKSWRVAKRDAYGPVQAGVYAVGFGPGTYLALGSNGLMNTFR